MSDQINLLRRRKTGQLEREKKILKILRISSISSLCIVIFLSLVLFILNINSPIFGLQKQQSELITQFSPLQEKAAKLLIAQSRIKDISAIINETSKFDETLSQISSSIPQDISIESFSLGKGKAELFLKSSSLSSIDIVLNDLTALVDNADVVSGVTIDQLEVDPSLGSYSVNVSLDLL